MNENCLESEDILRFEYLDACKGKKAALKITKTQIFSFREEKCSLVWSYDKTVLTLCSMLCMIVPTMEKDV